MEEGKERDGQLIRVELIGRSIGVLVNNEVRRKSTYSFKISRGRWNEYYAVDNKDEIIYEPPSKCDT